MIRPCCHSCRSFTISSPGTMQTRTNKICRNQNSTTQSRVSCPGLYEADEQSSSVDRYYTILICTHTPRGSHGPASCPRQAPTLYFRKVHYTTSALSQAPSSGAARMQGNQSVYHRAHMCVGHPRPRSWQNSQRQDRQSDSSSHSMTVYCDDSL